MQTVLRLHSPRTAWVDALRADKASALAQLTGIILFAALTALGAQVRVQIWEVPFTLQTLAVYGSGLFLGWRNGMLAQALYLTIGLLWPVYADGASGPAYLFGAPSAGFLLAFPLVAGLVGYLSKRWNTLAGVTLAMLMGSLVLFSFGVTWLHYAMDHSSWLVSLQRGWLPFIPVDLATVLCVGLAYTGLRRL